MKNRILGWLVGAASLRVLARAVGRNPAAERGSLSDRLFLSDSIVDKGRVGRNECAPSEATTMIATMQIQKCSRRYMQTL